MQAHKYMHADRMSHVHQQAAAARARVATAADEAVRAVRGGGASAAHLMSTVTEKR